MQTVDRWRFLYSLLLSLSLALSLCHCVDLASVVIRLQMTSQKSFNVYACDERNELGNGKWNETRWTRVRFGAKFVDYEPSSTLFCCHFLGRLCSLTLAERKEKREIEKERLWECLYCYITRARCTERNLVAFGIKRKGKVNSGYIKFVFSLLISNW